VAAPPPVGKALKSEMLLRQSVLWQCGHSTRTGALKERTSLSKWAPQASHWYS